MFDAVLLSGMAKLINEAKEVLYAYTDKNVLCALVITNVTIY